MTIKVAFIGAGRRARTAHYPAINRIQQMDLQYISELDESLAREVMGKYKIPHYYFDYREMLKRQIDAVYIVMKETQVTPIALDVINSGRHVFIEKPPGANIKDTQQLLDAAIHNNVHCMVGFQRRFASVTKEAMRLVHKRGNATLAIGEFHKYLINSPQPKTSTLWDDICHVIDTVRYMTNSEPLEVTSYQDSPATDWNTNYNALIRFRNGAVGIITGNRSSGGRYLRTELHGIGVGCYMQIPGEIEVHENGEGPNVLSGAEISGVPEDDTHGFDGVMEMHREFARSVMTGNTPLTDLRDVIHTMELVENIGGQ